MNETLNTIAKRYSCRSYDGRLPEKEKLETIAMAAVQSPSAMNRQPWKIIVITDKSFIEELDKEGMKIIAESEHKALYERMQQRGGRMYYNAPCMFLVLKQAGADLDVGIVSQNISLAATSLGIDNVICAMADIPLSGSNGEYLKSKAGFTEGWEFGMAVLAGYATVSGTPHEPDTSKICFL